MMNSDWRLDYWWMKAVLWTGVTGLHMQEKPQSFYMISASAWEFQYQLWTFHRLCDVDLYSYAEFDSLDASDRYRLMDMSARGGNRVALLFALWQSI